MRKFYQILASGDGEETPMERLKEGTIFRVEDGGVLVSDEFGNSEWKALESPAECEGVLTVRACAHA